LFRSASGIVSKPAVWRPFISAAFRAKADWRHGDSTESYKLACARAFAERHETNTVTESPAWPLPAELALSPEEEKSIFANMVQQSYDCGHPPAHLLLADFDRSVPAGLRQRSADQLKTTGAIWRAQAKQGHIEDACRAQTELAEEWVHRGQPDQASYPLSEAYRLSGFLNDAAAFGRLDRLCAEAPRAAAEALTASPFVRLQRGRALLSLGETRGAVEALRTVITDAPALVRYSAARLLARADAPDADLQAEMQRLARWAGPAAAPGDPNEARLFLTLEDLDRALATGDGAAEGEALARLEEMEQSLVRALVALATDRGRPAGRTVAEGFPY
jgi:hypothetical protein